MALPIAETDDTVLSVPEGEVLGTKYIRELLSIVDDAPDDSAWLGAERDRLQTEVDNLVKSIAAGVPGEAVGPAIRETQSAIAKLEQKLRVPRVPRLEYGRLKAALEQRAKEWKRELRAEPRIARLSVRLLIGPIVLHDEAQRPAFTRWEAAPTTELLEGLAPTYHVASPAGFDRRWKVRGTTKSAA